MFSGSMSTFVCMQNKYVDEQILEQLEYLSPAELEASPINY